MTNLKFMEIATNVASDRRIRKICRSVPKEFKDPGLITFVYVALQLFLARQGVYFIHFDEDLVSDIAEEYALRKEMVKKSIDILIENEIFNKKLFDTEKVITSEEIQEAFRKIGNRIHSPVDFSLGYCLLPKFSSSAISSAAKPFEKFAIISEDFANFRGGEGEDKDRNGIVEEWKGEEVTNPAPANKFVFPSELLNERWGMLLDQEKWRGKSEAQLQLAYEKLKECKEDVAIEMIEYTIQNGYGDVFYPNDRRREELALRKKVAPKKDTPISRPRDVEFLSEFSYLVERNEPSCKSATKVRNAWCAIQGSMSEPMKENAMHAKFRIENDTLMVTVSVDIGEWLKADPQRYRPLMEIFKKVIINQ